MSDAALLRPRAPAGGTMCAASPARKRLPQRIGSATNERSGAIDFSIEGPVIMRADTSAGRRRCSSAQKASSDQSSTLSASGTGMQWRLSACERNGRASARSGRRRRPSRRHCAGAGRPRPPRVTRAPGPPGALQQPRAALRSPRPLPRARPPTGPRGRRGPRHPRLPPVRRIRAPARRAASRDRRRPLGAARLGARAEPARAPAPARLRRVRRRHRASRNHGATRLPRSRCELTGEAAHPSGRPGRAAPARRPGK